MEDKHFGKIVLWIFVSIIIVGTLLSLSQKRLNEIETTGAAGSYLDDSNSNCVLGDNNCEGILCNSKECLQECKTIYTFSDRLNSDIKVTVTGACQLYEKTYACKTKAPKIPVGFELVNVEAQSCKI